MTPVVLEPLLGYHPCSAGFLTSGRDPAVGQCQVGSLTGAEDIRYLNQYDLEVQLQDTWYRIPAESGEEGRWLTLEAGMAVDEEIDLSEYQIDYDASQYRLVTHVGQETLGVEFTFGEVFKKTKEGESAE